MAGKSASVSDEDFCAAIEREIERWARLRKSQGSPAPGCTPSSYLGFLFSHNAWRAAHAMKRAEKAGLVTRRRFDCGRNAWRLTPAGSALAQEGVLLCRECAAVPSLNEDDTYDRCAACAADLLDDRAEQAAQSADYNRREAERHEDLSRTLRSQAGALRARADQLREDVALAR